MVTFTINIPQMLAYIPYMDPMGLGRLKWLKEMGDAIGHGSATSGTSETSARRARSKDLSGHGAPWWALIGQVVG